MNDRILISATQAAKWLGVSRAHFYRQHKAGLIPKPLRFGGAVRWRTKELQAWLEADAPNRLQWQAILRAEKKASQEAKLQADQGGVK